MNFKIEEFKLICRIMKLMEIIYETLCLEWEIGYKKLTENLPKYLKEEYLIE